MTLEAMKMNFESLLEEKQGGADEVYERLMLELGGGDSGIEKTGKKKKRTKKKPKNADSVKSPKAKSFTKSPLSLKKSLPDKSPPLDQKSTKVPSPIMQVKKIIN